MLGCTSNWKGFGLEIDLSLILLKLDLIVWFHKYILLKATRFGFFVWLTNSRLCYYFLVFTQNMLFVCFQVASFGRRLFWINNSFWLDVWTMQVDRIRAQINRGMSSLCLLRIEDTSYPRRRSSCKYGNMILSILIW